MAATVVASTKKSHSGLGGFSTDAIDTTGADFLLVAVSVYSGGSFTLSDSKSNTWQALTKYGTSVGFVQLYYCYNPTVGSDHTISFTDGQYYYSVFFYALDGMDTTSAVYDTSNGASSATTGNITPAESGELIVTAYNQYSSTSQPSVSGDFVLQDYEGFSNSVTPGGAVAFINTYDSTDAVGATWTGGHGEASAIAAFKLADEGFSFLPILKKRTNVLARR